MAHHPTETAVLKVLGYMVRVIDSGDLAILTLLDLQQPLTRGLRNSAIRFGIGISKTEPYRTELFIKFRKRRNSDTLHGHQS